MGIGLDWLVFRLLALFVMAMCLTLAPAMADATGLVTHPRDMLLGTWITFLAYGGALIAFATAIQPKFKFVRPVARLVSILWAVMFIVTGSMGVLTAITYLVAGIHWESAFYIALQSVFGLILGAIFAVSFRKKGAKKPEAKDSKPSRKAA